jgi:hypothetical protein
MDSFRTCKKSATPDRWGKIKKTPRPRENRELFGTSTSIDSTSTRRNFRFSEIGSSSPIKHISFMNKRIKRKKFSDKYSSLIPKCISPVLKKDPVKFVPLVPQ